MDLSFPRFDKDADASPLPSDLALLLVGITARQAASHTARIQQRQRGQTVPDGPLTPQDGAFNPGAAEAIADWKRE